MEQPRKIHPFSHKPEKPRTRSMTTQDNLHDHPSNPSTQQQPAHQAPGTSGRQNNEGRQDPEASTQRQPHQYQKGGKRTPKNGYRKLAASTVDLLTVRLSDIKF